MRNKPIFYFANQTSMAEHGREVELYIREHVNIETINPFFSQDGTPTPEIASMLRGEKPTENPFEVTARDLNKIREVDGIIAYLSKNELCIGTAWEMAKCVEMLGKPLYIISVVNEEFSYLLGEVEASNLADGAKEALYKWIGPKSIVGHPFPIHFGVPVFTSKEEFVEWAVKRWGAPLEVA